MVPWGSRAGKHVRKKGKESQQSRNLGNENAAHYLQELGYSNLRRQEQGAWDPRMAHSAQPRAAVLNKVFLPPSLLSETWM